MFAYRKAADSVFSFRHISIIAGYNSPTAFKHVIDGKRNLGETSAQNFGRALGLSRSEIDILCAMARFNHAKTIDEKAPHFETMRRLTSGAHRIDEKQYEVLSQWYNLVVREMVALPDFKNASKWIGRALAPSIEPDQAKKALQLLHRLGMIQKKRGGWEQAEAILATDPQIQSMHAAGFHRQMIQRGAEAIGRFTPEEREISGTILRINSNDRIKVVNLIRDFRKHLLAIAHASTDADQIYAFNAQFFPLVRPERKQRLKAPQS